MHKKLITCLIILAAALAILAGCLFAYAWYQESHVFVGEDAYPADSQTLDLTDREITPEYYEELQSQLPGCKITWNVPFQGGRIASDTESITVTTLSQEDRNTLKKYFPSLKTVQASGCSDYDALEALKAELPGVAVLYTVNLGGADAQPDADSLTLNPGEFTPEALQANLPHLKNLTRVEFPATELTLEQIQSLAAQFPEITFSYTVVIAGTEYPEDTQSLNLTGISPEEVPQAAEKLALLPELATLELADGTAQLSKEDAKALIQAAPQASAHYAFDFYGTQLTTDMTEVVLRNKSIGDDGEQAVREALDLLTSCQRFVLDNCRLSNAVMAQIREDYRGRTKVVWRVYFGDGSCLTDVDVIRCTYDLLNNNCAALTYCEDARYMDIGHNESLSTLEFMSGMTSMEYLIVSGAPIRDLTPLANLKNLKNLELANCGYVEDLTPLAQCESLTMLNVCNTRVADITPLENLKLELFSATGKPSRLIPQEQKDAFAEKHPDCWTRYKGFEYGAGWRYDTDNSKLPWYQEIANAFGYPHPLNNAGWYFQAEK